jgi:tetratricopeptide (TPR) repeat protein
MLRKAGHYAALIVWLALSAQAQSNSPKEIDIGAKEAPLTNAEREDLAKAVTAHNYAAEKAVIDQAAIEHPQSAELQVMAGRLAFLERHPKDAAEAYERAAKIKPLAEEDRISLAVVWQAIGKRREARDAMVKLTQDFPKDPQYEYLLGRFDSLDRHFEAAIADLQKALQLDPKLLKAYEDLGRAQEALGLIADARKTYEAGVARNRQDGARSDWPAIDLGSMLLKAGELEEAEKLFREALSYQPRSGMAHYYLAQIDERRNRREEAIAEYNAAVAAVPNLRQAWLALGREYTRAGQKEQAERCLAMFQQLEAKEQARVGGGPQDSSDVAETPAGKKP